MSAHAEALARLKAQSMNLKDRVGDLESQAMQHIVGIGGGVLGSMAFHFLPKVIPGKGGDAGALLGTVMLLDGMAAWSGSAEMLALALSYEGYATGSLFDVAMGWRKQFGQ